MSASICTLKMLSPGPKFKSVFSVYSGLAVLNLMLRNTNLGNNYLVNVKLQRRKVGKPFLNFFFVRTMDGNDKMVWN